MSSLLRFNLDNGGYYFWHIKSGTIQREMPLWPKELKTPVIPPTRWVAVFNEFFLQLYACSPIPGGDGTNSMFSVAFNSLYNYNSETNGSILNGNCNAGNDSTNSNSQSAFTRSTSSHALDLDQENKRRKELEFKWVELLSFLLSNF